MLPSSKLTYISVLLFLVAWHVSALRIGVPCFWWCLGVYGFSSFLRESFENEAVSVAVEAPFYLASRSI